MNQIRYFLAAARTLNFTKAASECSVSQPSLSRAIQTLECEFGGELFSRERRLTYLTELGRRMLPLLQSCFDCVTAARTVAQALRSETLAPLRVAVSQSIPSTLYASRLTELASAFEGLELKFVRGSGEETLGRLMAGEVELGLAGELKSNWGRLDRWRLHNEPLVVAVGERHRLAAHEAVDLAALREEPILLRSYCETQAEVEALLRKYGLGRGARHEAGDDADLRALLEANLGVAFTPASAPLGARVRRLPLLNANLTRGVWAYAVAGRQRSPIASLFLRLLRA